MTHKVSDPVAMDLIADRLYQDSNWGDNLAEIVADIAAIVEATGRDTAAEEQE